MRTIRTTDPPGLALSGDIDEETYPALVRALSKIPRGRAGIHVDLSAVEFCDLAGLRAILQLPGEGIPVVLYDVPERLLNLMAILGWDNTPGLTVTARSRTTRSPGRAFQPMTWQAQPDSPVTSWPLLRAISASVAWA